MGSRPTGTCSKDKESGRSMSFGSTQTQIGTTSLPPLSSMTSALSFICKKFNNTASHISSPPPVGFVLFGYHFLTAYYYSVNAGYVVLSCFVFPAALDKARTIYYYTLFTELGTETQRSQATSPLSHSR